MKILYKDTAVTLYNFIKQCKQEGYLQGKYCYCGRLDPMASGKMLFLEDKECSDMSAFLKCDKEYEFEICLGISTDTDDILGIIEEINFETLNTFDTMGMLDKQLNTILLQTTQQYHKFSAFQIKHNNIRVNLCELSKQHKLNKQDIPSKPCKVHSIKKLNKKTVNLIYYIDIILQKLEALHDPNDYYRKKEIIKRWKNFKSTIPKYMVVSLMIYKYKMTVSSGFYIRQLIADLKHNCNFPLMVLNIKRTQIYKDGYPL